MKKLSITLYPDVTTRRTSKVLVVRGSIKRTGAELVAHFPPNMGLANAILDFEEQWFDCFDRNGRCIVEDSDPLTMAEAVDMGVEF